jgi:hypothetical protein
MVTFEGGNGLRRNAPRRPGREVNFSGRRGVQRKRALWRESLERVFKRETANVS